MHTRHNVFLIGPMGAGKTTIGRQLAAALSFEFADSDHVIQKRTGVDIPTIFAFEGESGFRQRESQIIDELTQLQNLVLATGGGSVLLAENRRVLTARGFVIYLYCSPEQQHERTGRDRNRPLLKASDPAVNPLDRLRQLAAERDPLYQQIADLTVTTEKRAVPSVVREILRYFEREWNE
ncbi:shikimate kinase [Achromatium sp. WMS2]|nr:shikimate kinase [Achromatium sp. WMS2]